MTDGFNNKAQLTEALKLLEQSMSSESENHISLSKLLLHSLNTLFGVQDQHIYIGIVGNCNAVRRSKCRQGWEKSELTGAPSIPLVVKCSKFLLTYDKGRITKKL